MVGDILRSARVKQGLTIADIEKGTSIRALYIESIEQSNIDNLPGMVYAKGFVRNYAGFLHLDAEELVQQFAAENGTAAAPAAPTTEEKPVMRRSLRSPSAAGNLPLRECSASWLLGSWCSLHWSAAVRHSSRSSILLRARRPHLRHLRVRRASRRRRRQQRRTPWMRRVRPRRRRMCA